MRVSSRIIPPSEASSDLPALHRVVERLHGLVVDASGEAESGLVRLLIY